MTGRTFDLQAHSTVSDGALPPAEVVRRAKQAGIELLAVTDHDTVGGLDEAVEAARACGVALSPATEVSSVDPGHEDLHVLGYEIDHRSPALLEALEDWRCDRRDRIIAMADRLREFGFTLDTSELRRRRDVGQPLGRPHLATAVWTCEPNRERLADEGVVTIDDLFAAYLTPGGRAYVSRTRPTVKDAIDVIHAAGGVAVWAHPFWDVHDRDAVSATVRRFVDLGLDGIEAFYVTHTRGQVEHLVALAEDHGLLTTGSADFHSDDHEWFRGFGTFELYGFEPRLGPIGERLG